MLSSNVFDFLFILFICHTHTLSVSFSKACILAVGKAEKQVLVDEDSEKG